MMRALVLSAAAAVLGSCGQTQRSGPVRVSIIQSGAGDTSSPFNLALRSATARGLVRLDTSGQIVPDLAARWAIVDDGLDYIFRLDDGVAPKLVARRLRALLAARSNPRRSWLAPIERIEAVTATVIEIRLSSPMPDLLILLAHSEMALADLPGPMRATPTAPATAALAVQGEADNDNRLAVAGERAGRAVARFAAGRDDLLLGGTFRDLPIANAAILPAGALVRDPAVGLFGFARHATDGPTADRAVMRALSLAIDRDRIAALVGGAGAEKATTIAGSTLEPPMAERLPAARTAIPAPMTIRVAIPDGPGGRLLFALVAQDWRRIGVVATAVAQDAPADLALVDLVVPAGEIARIACVVSAGCDPRDPQALIDPSFIPLMQPVRWSLIAPRIDGFTANPLAAHPLEQISRSR